MESSNLACPNCGSENTVSVPLVYKRGHATGTATHREIVGYEIAACRSSEPTAWHSKSCIDPRIADAHPRKRSRRMRLSNACGGSFCHPQPFTSAAYFARSSAGICSTSIAFSMDTFKLLITLRMDAVRPFSRP